MVKESPSKVIKTAVKRKASTPLNETGPGLAEGDASSPVPPVDASTNEETKEEKHFIFKKQSFNRQSNEDLDRSVKFNGVSRTKIKFGASSYNLLRLFDLLLDLVVKNNKKRILKSLKQILAQERSLPWPESHVHYTHITAPPSFKPAKKYSDISGLTAKYTDPQTKLQYAMTEEFTTIRSLPSDIISGYLQLRGVNSVIG